LSLTVRSEPAPRRHSDSVYYVPYFIPYTAAPSSDGLLQQQQLLTQLCGAEESSQQQQQQQQQQQRRRQPRQKLFSPGTLSALQQVLPAVPTPAAVPSATRSWNSNAFMLAHLPGGVTSQSDTQLAVTDGLSYASAAAAAVAALQAATPVASSAPWSCGYQQQQQQRQQQQTDADFEQQPPSRHHHHQQQQQQECVEVIVPLGWLDSQGGSTAEDTAQKPDAQQQQQQRKRRSTELVAVGWLPDLPYPCHIAATFGDLQIEPEQPDTPTNVSSSAAGLNSAEQRRWGYKEHSSAVLIAVPTAASGELDSLAALPLVNPYSAKAAAVVGASSWQGWQSGHTPHMRLAAVDRE
jgi:hypothetical protein